MSGGVIYPIVIDPRYTVDIDNLQEWARYEHLVSSGELDMVTPGKTRRPMPDTIKLVICDFDGVITDGRVWTDQDGRWRRLSLHATTACGSSRCARTASM